MYCKKCGKTLEPGDKFCSNCGTRIEPEFVPAFKQNDFSSGESEEKKKRRSFTTPDFSWDLEGYPTDTRKTEDIDFNWNSVLEEKQRNLFKEESEKSPQKEQEPARTPLAAQVKKEAEQGEVSEQIRTAHSAFEEALFADMGALKSDEPTRAVTGGGSKFEKIDKFYTFNKKNEEFQQLLDKEYERLKNGQDSGGEGFSQDPAGSRHEEFDWTLPGERDLGRMSETAAYPGSAFSQSRPQTEYVGVALSQPPLGYEAPAVQEVTEEIPQAEFSEGAEGLIQPVVSESAAHTEHAETSGKEEEAFTAEQFRSRKRAGKKTEATEEEGNARLTFDDVFGDDDDDIDKEPKKKGTALKIIAIILCILAAAELVMLGIQYFAPESKAAGMINRGYEKVLNLFSGQDDKDLPEPAAEEPSEIAGFIEEKKDLGKNIAAVEEDEALTFENGKNYGFDDFSNAYTFVNKPWYTDDSGNSVTYGEEIVSALIQYYSLWVDKMNGKNEDILEWIDETSDFYGETEALEGKKDVQYGINKLRVGEIRAAGAGFYICVSVEIAESDTDKTSEEKQIVYMEPVNKNMKIVSAKEI